MLRSFLRRALLRIAGERRSILELEGIPDSLLDVATSPIDGCLRRAPLLTAGDRSPNLDFEAPSVPLLDAGFSSLLIDRTLRRSPRPISGD